MKTQARSRKARAGKAAPDILGRRRGAIKEAFRLDLPEGRAAAIAGGLVFITPILAFYVSNWLLFILIPALVLSLVTVPRVQRARAGDERLHRAAETGLAMTINGVLLFLSLIVVGFLEDFVAHSGQGIRGRNVAEILTVVHILLGVGIQLWDSFRD